MSATCLKTSPVFPSSRFSPPPPPSFFFFPHTRMYCGEKEREREGGRRKGQARSFDSTAFLPIRQTFDSFTWEPRNSSWWLPSSSLGPLRPRSSVRYVWFLASIPTTFPIPSHHHRFPFFRVLLPNQLSREPTSYLQPSES